MLILGLIY